MSDDVDLHRARRRRPEDEDRAIPPHSIEAEVGVLGSILLSPKEVLPEVRAKITTGEVFYDLRHRTIYEAMCELDDDQTPVDSITLTGRLRAFRQLDAIGGAVYLSSLPDNIPSASNAGFYLKCIIEKYQLRKVIQLCTGVIARVYDHEGEVDTLLDEFESEALKIRIHEGATVSTNCAPAVNKAMKMIECYHERKGGLSGIGTGFPDLDKMTDGFHPGEMIVIAGRPSMGKSSIAMNFAESIVLQQRIPVGVFSLEMTAEALMLRTITSRARVNVRNIREGFLAERDIPKLTAAAANLRNALLYIDDTPGLTVAQIRARARRMVQQFGIKLFVIDYFQTCALVIKKGDTKQGAYSDISNGIKLMARELNVPVIVLSQISRTIERENRKPNMGDLKETGALEQDADLIGILYKPALKEDGEAESDAIPVNLLICKQRNGPTGDVHLTFLKSYTRFESAAKITGDDVPEDDQPNMI